MNAVNYIQNNIDNIIHILNTNGFLEYGYGITSKGIFNMKKKLEFIYSTLHID